MKVKRKGDTIKVIAGGHDYRQSLHGLTALKMTNTGNEWVVKFPALTDQYDQVKIKLDFEQIALLALAFEKLKDFER